MSDLNGFSSAGSTSKLQSGFICDLQQYPGAFRVRNAIPRLGSQATLLVATIKPADLAG